MSENGKELDVGGRLAEAVDQGRAYCEVCNATIDLSDASGFEEGRSRMLDHAEENHE